MSADIFQMEALRTSPIPKWDGMGWDGMGWDGMGWDGMELNLNSMLFKKWPWLLKTAQEP